MKRRRVSVWWALGILVGVCILLLLFRPWDHGERRQPSYRDRGETEPPSRVSSKPPTTRVSRDRKPSESTTVRFGILGPAVSASERYGAISACLKCVNSCGCPCDVVATPGTDGDSLRSLLQAESIEAQVCSFDAGLKRANVLLVMLEVEADHSTVSKLKSFAASGGWLAISGNAPLVRRIARISGGPTRKLNSTWDWVRRTNNSMARLLVAHPALPGTGSGDWFPIPDLEGDAGMSRPGTGLWLIAFRNPSSPGLRILPIQQGGVVALNWRAWKSGKLGDIESRDILHNTIAWLAEEPFWPSPERIPLQRVTGRVVDEEGLAVAAADVTARVFADWGEEFRTVASKTDENGSFSLVGVGPAIYWFDASAQGFSQEDPFILSRCEDGVEQELVTIVLRRTADVFGTVYYEGREDAPAPEFPVTLLATDRDPEIEPRTTVTDQQGQFAFEKAPFGKTYLVSSQKGEWGGWKMVELPLDPEEKPERVALAIERLPLVYGRVVEHETYKPIPGARVEITPREFDRTLTLFSGSLTQTERSDEEKGFSFRLLAGRWWLCGEAEGHSEAFIREGYRQRSVGRTDLKIAFRGMEPECPIILQLRRGWQGRTKFYGTVYQPSGEPAPNALIECGSFGSFRSFCTSDSDGRYVTEPVFYTRRDAVNGITHHHYVFTVRWGELVGHDSVPFEDPPERYQHDLWLEEAEAAKGFVRDAKGNPVEGARVAVVVWHSRDVRTDASCAVHSEADGSFTLPAVVPRSKRDQLYAILLRAEKVVEIGESPCRYAGEAYVTIPAKGPIEAFDIIITREGPVKGTISYHDGRPLRNNSGRVALQYQIGRNDVWLTHSQGHLGERGDFSLNVPGFDQRIYLRAREEGREDWVNPRMPPPETCQLRVERYGTTEGSVVMAANWLIVDGVKVGDTDLDIRFPPLGAIHGRIVDGETGVPVEAYDISAHPNDPPEKWGVGCWNTGVWLRGDASLRGEFHFLDVPPGTYPSYTLRVNVEGYCGRRFGEVLVRANETTDMGDISLYRNWWIKGRVIDAESGQPVAATVSHYEAGTTTTDDQGRFLLTMPAAGPYYGLRVTVSARDARWKKKYVSARYVSDPVVDVGDVALERAAPE